MDIIYISMVRGFVYLATVVECFSRKALAWKLSITLETAFCLEAVEEALARLGKPEIFNADQGSRFTSTAFTGLLTKNEIRISMDGKGACRDNVFVERLWRTINYEEFYLRTYANVPGRAPQSPDISTASTTPHDPIRALTDRHRTRPTSTGCSQSRLWHNDGRTPLKDHLRLFKQNERRLRSGQMDPTHL